MNRYTKIKDFCGERAKGVGSSDIPTLAGLAKQYGQTPYTLWLEKTGREGRKPAGPRADWGHRLEPLILARWVEDHYGIEEAMDYYAAAIRGRSYGPYKRETEARMKGRPYVLAHADLLIDRAEGPCIVEAKSTGFFSAKRREGEAYYGYDAEDRTHQGIPDSVYLQVQWQMLAYDVPVAFVAVLIDTGDYREYGPIYAAPRVQEKCLALAERFWACIEEDRPPKPETWGDVAAMWPEPVEKTAMVGGEDEMKARAYAAEYHTVGEKIKALETRREELKSALGIYMGENSVLTTADGTKLASSWSQDNPERVDLSRMKKEKTDVYDTLVEGGYITRTTRRELRPAKIKEA